MGIHTAGPALDTAQDEEELCAVDDKEEKQREREEAG
jgi:hypothetical protein